MAKFKIQPIPKQGGQVELDRWREEVRRQINNAELNNLQDVNLDDPPTANDLFVYVGGEWINQSISTTLDPTYLRLDTTNDPLTGNLTIDLGGLVNAQLELAGSTHHGLISTATDIFKIRDLSSGIDRLSIANTGALQLNQYGSGSITGTDAYYLATDSSGNVIEVTLPDFDATYLRLDTANDPLTDSLTIQGSQDVAQLVIQANTSQTENLLVTKNSSGISNSFFDYEGDLFLGKNIAAANKAHLTISGTFAQSANLMEFKNYQGSIRSFFNWDGGLEVQKTGTNTYINANNQSVNLAIASDTVTMISGNGTIGNAGNREFVAGSFVAGAKVGGMSKPVIGGRFSCVPSHPSGGFPDAYGGQFVISHQDTGTVTRGFVGDFSAIENVFSAGPGFFDDLKIINISYDLKRLTINNDLSGICIGAPSFSTGGVTGNAYGLLMEQNTAGANSYQIYSEGGTSLLNCGTDVTALILKAYSSQTNDIFQIQDSSASNLVVVDGAGNVGIGAAPVAKLSVKSSSSTGSTVSGWSTAYSVFGPNADSTTGAGFAIGYNTSTDTSEFVSIAPGIAWKPLNIYSNGIGFYSKNANHAVTINSSGNVGIGTSDPLEKLDVEGRITIAPTGIDNDNAYNGSLVITQAPASGQYINLIRSGQFPWSIGTLYNTSTFAIGQGYATDSNFANAFFVIDGSGNVGIGTAAPTERTQINGNLFLQSDSDKIYLGAGKDTSLLYDGTDFKIDTGLVTASDFVIDCGTNKTLELAETVWEDIQFPISAGKQPASSAPTWATLTTNTGEYGFDVNEYIDLASNELCHKWKEGTDGDFHMHLSVPTANTSGSSQYAKFTIYISYVNSSYVWTETSLTAEVEVIDGTPALRHFYLGMSTVSFSGLTIGTQVKLRVKRIAATGGTEYPSYVFIHQIGCHIECDTIGSRTISTK